MLQNPNFPELLPGPRWGSLQRSPDPLADGEGARCLFPKNPPRVNSVLILFLFLRTIMTCVVYNNIKLVTSAEGTYVFTCVGLPVCLHVCFYSET